jgi:methyl-accepting chemotaxis protein
LRNQNVIMEQIGTLSSVEGRKLLYAIYQELRYQKQMSNLAILALTWRICTTEREISRYTKQEVQVLHPLGFFRGTALWMEEIVNRFYFSTINSFVYLGAAILLVLIGIRRFSSTVSDSIVIAGVAFEAMMLLFMFIVMLFTPSEDALPVDKSEDDPQKELLYEIGEIATDFATAVSKLESLGDNVKNLLIQQTEILTLLRESNEMTRQIISPSPKLLEIMQETNKSLQQFKESLDKLNQATEQLAQEEIEIAVRKELEKFFTNIMNNKDAK